MISRIYCVKRFSQRHHNENESCAAIGQNIINQSISPSLSINHQSVSQAINQSINQPIIKGSEKGKGLFCDLEWGSQKANSLVLFF